MLYSIDMMEESHNIQNANFDGLYKRETLKVTDLIGLNPHCTWEKVVLNNGDNYDGHHTDIMLKMLQSLNEKKVLPPIVLDTNMKLYDGWHRLTAFYMLGIENIVSYVEVVV